MTEFIKISRPGLWFWFEDAVLAVVLALFAIWLILDILVLYKNRVYSLSEMMLFGYGMNALGIGCML